MVLIFFAVDDDVGNVVSWCFYKIFAMLVISKKFLNKPIIMNVNLSGGDVDFTNDTIMIRLIAKAIKLNDAD